MSTPNRFDAPPGANPNPELRVEGDLHWAEIQASEEFQGLKRALRRFIFPATAVFLAWYLLYVLMTVYARGFLRLEVFGRVNVAYLFGLSQFVSTFVIAYVYSRYADKYVDPTADRIRQRAEGAQQ